MNAFVALFEKPDPSRNATKCTRPVYELKLTVRYQLGILLAPGQDSTQRPRLLHSRLFQGQEWLHLEDLLR
jgi:hypothetical protein